MWKKDLAQYIKWRNLVDSEILLDQFDLALGWFSGKGYSHDEAIEAAKFMKKRTVKIDLGVETREERC